MADLPEDMVRAIRDYDQFLASMTEWVSKNMALDDAGHLAYISPQLQSVMDDIEYYRKGLGKNDTSLSSLALFASVGLNQILINIQCKDV